MKKKIQRLEPIQGISKSQASYQKLMLEMMSKLVGQTKENNALMKEHFRKSPKIVMGSSQSTFKERTNLPHRVPSEDWQEVQLSPGKLNEGTIEEVYESVSGNNLRPKNFKNTQSAVKIGESGRKSPYLVLDEESKFQKILSSFENRMKIGEEVNKKLLEKIQRLESEKSTDMSKSHHIISSKDPKEDKINELSWIEKALGSKLKSQVLGNSVPEKKNYGILTQILPYSDRRQIKIKFSIEEIVNMAEESKIEDLKLETAEWLGMVYRATASICWNMLLNNYLSFQEVKILFTENIIFNFIEFMKEMKKIGRDKVLGQLTSIINKKSVSILDYLCRQYPQTKIEAPNLALRSVLPQIDNQGRIKYDMVWKSGLTLTYKENGDYTDQIMRMINFMIEKSNEEYEGFFGYMKDTFEELFLPIEKRRKMEEGVNDTSEREFSSEDYKYRQKAKGYTKYLIGRKIPKNTLPYTEEEIDDGIFFVKSNAVLRIITKWVQELKEYFEDPDKKIKNNYNENKDYLGNILYLSALLKNGIHKKILQSKDALFEKINKIREECFKMEYLLTAEQYTSDSNQIHLSNEQISVGMYSVNIKRVISSYICSELNKLIHFLLKIPKEIPEETLGNDLEVFQLQARKDLDSVNLITFKLFDLLRCKIHSNEEEIIWIVNYLIHQSKVNRNKFKIVRIKDRLGMGTRDIMINGQINRGLVCEIQISVTSNTDKKQELLDSYNHFLYELKRSELGSITQNVSIWSNLEQRYTYFEQLMVKKSKSSFQVAVGKPQKHKCGLGSFKTFKRPLLCNACNKFYPIPKTCLLNVLCGDCGTTFCGECYYYNYLDADQRKQFIFDKNRLIKHDVMSKLVEYTDYTQPFPTPGFFIKKDFLTKEMSFYMAIEKNKEEKSKDDKSKEEKTKDKVQILVIQTMIRNGAVFNRQINKKEIQARMENGEFYIKDYKKTELNNFIIFSFDKQHKKMMTLKSLKTELEKPQQAKAKVLNILKEPSYIHSLHLLKKENEKVKELNSLSSVIGEGKIIVYVFHNFYLLAQVLVKGGLLRADIRKRLNLNELKSFAQKESDIVSMEYKHMTTEMQELQFKLKPKLYESFCKNLRKLFLSSSMIESIKCFKDFGNLETIFISQNKLTSLEGIENCSELMSLSFDHNQIESLEPLANNLSLRYIFANGNKIKSLKGLENLTQLRTLSIYENEIESLNEIRDSPQLDTLIVRQNPITDLSVIQTLKMLHKLYIGKTKASVIPDLSMLKDLKMLSMEELNLTQVPKIFEKLQLQELSLSNNKIEDISGLKNQTELIFLSLTNNKISKIKDLGNLDKLEALKLNSNNISTIQGLKNLDSLKYLNLKNNPISDLGELSTYEITFKYMLSQESLTKQAKKQLNELQMVKSCVYSSGQD